MTPIEDKNLDQIEYLLQLSSQGHHFLFEKQDIVKALKKSVDDEKDFFDFDNKNRIQNLLLRVIEKDSFSEKQCFLETLQPEGYELVIRAYFHLVDNTILQKSNLKH